MLAPTPLPIPLHTFGAMTYSGTGDTTIFGFRFCVTFLSGPISLFIQSDKKDYDVHELSHFIFNANKLETFKMVSAEEEAYKTTNHL